MRLAGFVSSLLLCIVFMLLPPGLNSSGTVKAEMSAVHMSSDSDIQRVSIATRSDGLGYVVRFHFSSPPESFRLIQPEAGHVQVHFLHFGATPDTSRVTVFEPFTEISFTPVADGHGTDIRLESPQNYIARAYPDQNGRDILVAFTEASASQLALMTEGMTAISWETPEPRASGLPDDTASGGSFPDFPINGDEIQIDNGRLMPSQINRSAISFNTIILDPGHGGRDPGAIGAGGTYEKTIALAVARKVGGYIEQYLPELNVVYTRDDDTFIGLAERGRLANKNEGHLFVSIHTNSHTGRQANGAEFYFLGIGRTSSALEVMRRENSVIRFEEGSDATEELTEQQLMVYEMQNIGNMAMSQHFAEMLDHQFSQRAQRRSRGVKQAGLQVLYEASMPGVLIELGFISNPSEERFMNSEYGQNILASAIFRAIRDYRENFERAQRDRNTN